MVAYEAGHIEPVMPGEYSEREPPDSISNSEVKTFSADDSVVFRHVKVGHCQAFIQRRAHRKVSPFSLNNTYQSYFHCERWNERSKQSTALRELNDSNLWLLAVLFHSVVD